jgi:hypothetical protein
MIRNHVFFVLMCFVLIPANGEAQNTIDKSKELRFGFMTGVGRHWLLDVNYDYQLILLQPQIYYRFYARKLHAVEMLLLPQVNASFWTDNKQSGVLKRDFEFGLNWGLVLRQMFAGKNAGVYSLITTGPHYVSDVPQRQSPGFLFASQLGAGFTFKLTESASIDIRTSYRHISNAGLKEPNAGVESWLFLVGIMIKKPVLKH